MKFPGRLSLSVLSVSNFRDTHSDLIASLGVFAVLSRLQRRQGDDVVIDKECIGILNRVQDTIQSLVPDLIFF